MSNLQSKLKMLRLSRGLTQKQLAIEIGASDTGVQNYELGTRKPTFEMTAALAEYFGVSANYLLSIGVFRNEDLIIKHRKAIEYHIKDQFPLSFYEILPKLNDLNFLTILDSCVEKVEISEHPDSNQVDIMIAPKFPFND